jgi:hypothetical protein
VSNKIQERIDGLVKALEGRRHTGRTNGMLKEVLETVIKEGPDKKYVVFAENEIIADWVMQTFIEHIPCNIPVTNRANKCIEINNSLIYFKSESFRDNPSFKYMKWDDYWNDNSIYDKDLERHISYLRSQLDYKGSNPIPKVSL